MTDFIHLLGAQDVRAAGASMNAAADTMSRAAASIDESLTRHSLFLEHWLMRLEHLLQEARSEPYNIKGGNHGSN